MARRGLWSAHRYLEADSGNTRTVGRDGRPLVRPWRLVAPEIAERVRVHRRARPQPRWPRLLGGVFVLTAMVAAFDPVHSIPRHVAGSASTETGGPPLHLSAIAPDGQVAGDAWHFAWRGARAGDRLTLVVCDASYEEVLRVGVQGESFAPEAPLRDRLAALGTFHWFVETTVGDRTFRSPFATCERR